MSILIRIEKLEKRMTELELALPRSTMRPKRVSEWIVETLKRSPGRRIHGGVIPKGAESVMVFFEMARKAGISPPVLRAARLMVEDRVEACHIPGTRRWMWRLM